MDPSLSRQGLTCQAKWTVRPGFCKICKLVWRVTARFVNHISRQIKFCLVSTCIRPYTFTFRFDCMHTGVWGDEIASKHTGTIHVIAFICALCAWAKYIHQWFQGGCLCNYKICAFSRCSPLNLSHQWVWSNATLRDYIPSHLSVHTICTLNLHTDIRVRVLTGAAEGVHIWGGSGEKR